MTHSIPLENNSDGAGEGHIDASILDGGNSPENHVYNMSGGNIPNSLSTLQPRSSSVKEEESDDVYPYANPSPVINKP